MLQYHLLLNRSETKSPHVLLTRGFAFLPAALVAQSRQPGDEATRFYAKDWIALAGILITLTIALVNLLLTQRREKDERRREAERQKRERTYVPQLEFSINCNFYGPEEDSYLVEVLLTVHNKGRVQQKFRNLILRIRGIRQDQPLTYWEERKPRLYFPEELVRNESVIPAGVEYFFAEPGEEHVFTYVTKIPSSVKYILAYATFSYGHESSHDAERVFPVRAG
jgi:hypothetical protein